MNHTLPVIKTTLPGPKSEQLMQTYEKYVAQAVSHYTKLFASKAKGALIEDVDGNVFLDFASGIGVVNVGHAPDEVVEAINRQADNFIHTSSNIVLYEPYARVAERLCSVAPVPDAKCMLVNSGAEAVENAVKVARKYTGKSGVVTISGSFHGRTLMALGMTSKVKPYKHGFGPFMEGVYSIRCPNLYRNDSGLSDEGFALKCADDFALSLKTSLSPDMIACVIVEPVQGEGGFVPMPPIFMKRLQEICNENGILLILDEIQTGFARTGAMFAAEQLGAQPDIITMAKGIAGGLPLSAVVGRSEIMDSVHVGGLGGTYSGNPISCAAALATIDNIEKYDLCEKASALGSYIRSRCLKMQEKYECIGDVRGMGAMQCIELVKDRGTKEPAPEMISRILAASLKRGVIFISAGMLSNVIRFLPPLVMSMEQTEYGMDALDAAIGESLQ